MVADTDGIDDDEVIFSCGIGRDGFQIIRLDDANTSALHLLEEGAGFDRAHEYDNLDRLDVGAGGDHVHGDGDAGMITVAKALDEVLGRHPGGAIGDLLGELIALAELLAEDFNDVFRVGVVLGKDKGLRHLGATGKDVGEELVLEGFDDGANLVRSDHVAVELVGIVGEVVVESLPALGPRLPIHQLHAIPRLHRGACLRDGGTDTVHIVVHVDAVGHGLLVVVFHDEVLIEEAEGLLVGRGGEADEVGIEVFQYLRPEVVDGPVAFVGDDDIEGFDRNGRVIVQRFGFLEEPFEAGDGSFFVLIRQLPPFEHGVHALDSADANARGGIQSVARQSLDDELFSELEVVVRRHILLKLFQCLVAEIAAIDQEEHALGPAELDEPVDEVDSREGLTAAGGHLDEGTRTILRQRLFEIVDGDNLCGPEAGCAQGWQRF